MDGIGTVHVGGNSRCKCTELLEEAEAKGLAWVKIDNENTVNGGIAKFITDEIRDNLEANFGVKPNDAIFFIADELRAAQKIAGLVRIELGKRLDLLEKKGYTKYWLYKQLGMSYQNFTKMVNNQTKSIRYENIETMCLLLECTPNDLFEITED